MVSIKKFPNNLGVFNKNVHQFKYVATHEENITSNGYIAGMCNCEVSLFGITEIERKAICLQRGQVLGMGMSVGKGREKGPMWEEHLLRWRN